MAKLLNHVGRIRTTKKKCLVVFRTLPNESNYCLVVLTENLSDANHDALINLVESNAAQSAGEFGEVLARHRFPDGSLMLSALHVQDRLIKVPTDQVEMTPTTANTVVLSELNQLIAEQRGVTVGDLAVKGPDSKIGNTATTLDNASKIEEVVEAIEVPLTVDHVLSDVELAANLRTQAAVLEKERIALLEQAEQLSPTVKPVVKSEPVVNATVTETTTATIDNPAITAPVAQAIATKTATATTKKPVAKQAKSTATGKQPVKS